MLRILNNFAYTRGFLEDQPTLKFVDGVNAILYYEIDNTIYSIKCEGKTVSWYKNGEEILMHEGNDKQKKRFYRRTLYQSCSIPWLSTIRFMHIQLHH